MQILASIVYIDKLMHVYAPTYLYLYMYMDTTRREFDLVSGFSQHNWSNRQPDPEFFLQVSDALCVPWWDGIVSQCEGCKCFHARIEQYSRHRLIESNESDLFRKIQTSTFGFSSRLSFLCPSQGHREPRLWETLLRKPGGVWGVQFTSSCIRFPSSQRPAVRPRRSWCLCRHLWLLRWGHWNQNQIRSQRLEWSDALIRSLAMGYRCMQCNACIIIYESIIYEAKYR